MLPLEGSHLRKFLPSGLNQLVAVQFIKFSEGIDELFFDRLKNLIAIEVGPTQWFFDDFVNR